jgi:hypothetical protein
MTLLLQVRAPIIQCTVHPNYTDRYPRIIPRATPSRARRPLVASQLLGCGDPLDLSLRACEVGSLVAAARRSHGLTEAGLARYLGGGQVPAAEARRAAAAGTGMSLRSLSAGRVWAALAREGHIDLTDL